MSLESHIIAIDKLQDKVIASSEKILPSIDLDELLKNPEVYLNSLASQFLERHIPEIKKSAEQGRKFAKEVLK